MRRSNSRRLEVGEVGCHAEPWIEPWCSGRHALSPEMPAIAMPAVGRVLSSKHVDDGPARRSTSATSPTDEPPLPGVPTHTAHVTRLLIGAPAGERSGVSSRLHPEAQQHTCGPGSEQRGRSAARSRRLRRARARWCAPGGAAPARDAPAAPERQAAAAAPARGPGRRPSERGATGPGQDRSPDQSRGRTHLPKKAGSAGPPIAPQACVAPGEPPRDAASALGTRSVSGARGGRRSR